MALGKGKMAVFAQRLRGMQQQVDQYMSSYTPGGDRLADGVYIGKEACELAESSTSGKLMVKRQFTVADGEFTGRNGWDNLVIEDNEVGIQICRRWIELHGCPWPEDDLGKLEMILNRINELNCLVKFRVKTTTSNKDGQEYTNMTVMSLLEDAPDFSDIVGGEEPTQAEQAQEVEPEAEPAEGDELDGMDRTALKKLIAGDDRLTDIRVTIKWTDDDIRNAIREKLTAEEPAEAEEPATEGPSVEDVLAFCASQGVEGATEGMAVEELQELMSGYGFQRNELTADEINMLEQLGLTANIQNPAPSSKPAAKPKAAAPAPKPAAKAPVAAPKPAVKPAAPAAKAPGKLLNLKPAKK